MKAVILAAGKSTRTYPLTLTRPKPLLPLLNKPLLQHQLEALEGLVKEVVLVVGYRQDLIRERFGQEFRGLSLNYVMQAEQRGTGHAILECRDAVRNPFLVLNGDDLYERADLERLTQCEVGILAKRVADPQRFGVIETERGRLTRLIEKPQQPASDLVNTGAYKLPSAIFDLLGEVTPSERGEIELTAAVQRLAEQSAVTVVEAEDDWLSIAYPWHLLDASERPIKTKLRPGVLGEVSPAAHLSGPISIGDGSVIRPGVVVDGPVLIGDHCEIGPNCWLRPGTVLGNGCKVGQASEIKNSIFLENAKAPHQNYVGDSIIGEGVNLGCGTVTANLRHDNKNIRSMVNGKVIDTGRRKLGTIIGDHVHTGILTSIYCGRKLWPHTTTLPGEVVSKDKEK